MHHTSDHVNLKLLKQKYVKVECPGDEYDGLTRKQSEAMV